MEDWGFTVNSNVNVALESVLHGKETPEEREEALIEFIRNYDKSATECFNDLRTKALVKNNMMFMVGIICAIAGAAITLMFFLL